MPGVYARRWTRGDRQRRTSTMAIYNVGVSLRIHRFPSPVLPFCLSREPTGEPSCHLVHSFIYVSLSRSLFYLRVDVNRPELEYRLELIILVANIPGILQERRKVAAILLEYTCSVLYGHPTIRVFEYTLAARCASNTLAFGYSEYIIHKYILSGYPSNIIQVFRISRYFCQ